MVTPARDDAVWTPALGLRWRYLCDSPDLSGGVEICPQRIDFYS